MNNSPTIPRCFLDQVAAAGDRTAIHVKVGGRYQAKSWNQVLTDVRVCVHSLQAMGVAQGDRVIHFSENRYEWVLTDLALHIVGAVHVPVHATLAGEQVLHQVIDSDAVAMLVSRHELLDRVNQAGALPGHLHIATFQDAPPSGSDLYVRLFRPVSQLEGSAVDAVVQLEQSVTQRITGDTLATILYTSGTTGEPKGVMLNQSNLYSNASSANAANQQDEHDVRLNLLPLSHIFARTCDLYSWVLTGAQLALAESRETVLDDCQAVHPTVMNAVPYFYGRLQKILLERGTADHPGALMDLLGGRIRICCSGGAPLTLPLFDYFQSQHVPLLQGYGLTESSPVISASTPTRNRRGAVGPAIGGVEVQIADDGEVLTRGPHVMQGYWKNQQATDQVIRDQWLHTGDLGRLDEDGFLYITGRKKELIVTATGKNVAPAYLEALLVEDPLILQALVIGDNRKFLTALIVVDDQAVQDALAREDAPSGENDPADARHRLVQTRIAERLTAVSKTEQIGAFTVLPRPLSAEHGELTAKLSLRRAVIERNWSAEIEAMYQS